MPSRSHVPRLTLQRGTSTSSGVAPTWYDSAARTSAIFSGKRGSKESESNMNATSGVTRACLLVVRLAEILLHHVDEGAIVC